MESLQSTQGALLFGVWFSLYEESDKEISPRLFVRFKKLFVRFSCQTAPF